MEAGLYCSIELYLNCVELDTYFICLSTNVPKDTFMPVHFIKVLLKFICLHMLSALALPVVGGEHLSRYENGIQDTIGFSENIFSLSAK